MLPEEHFCDKHPEGATFVRKQKIQTEKSDPAIITESGF